MAQFFLSNKAVEDLSRIYEYAYEFWSDSQADIMLDYLRKNNDPSYLIWLQSYPKKYKYYSSN
ncbi:plasmid stabilization system protein ParE [Chryseobacterium sp. 2987]|nr:plasmid stabilization system protein ParE [Chryseobacterium sp. 2987]